MAVTVPVVVRFPEAVRVVTPDRAPELMIKPLIVLVAVAPVIAPEKVPPTAVRLPELSILVTPFVCKDPDEEFIFPVTPRDVRVPTLVMLGCAAVERVPVKVVEVNVPIPERFPAAVKTTVPELIKLV